ILFRNSLKGERINNNPGCTWPISAVILLSSGYVAANIASSISLSSTFHNIIAKQTLIT
ncbi:hypothetical protein L9F63_008790, partial [Diploptera punctata]